jgi:GH24 family phage-related lysozyme (muramidase)
MTEITPRNSFNAATGKTKEKTKAPLDLSQDEMYPIELLFQALVNAPPVFADENDGTETPIEDPQFLIAFSIAPSAIRQSFKVPEARPHEQRSHTAHAEPYQPVGSETWSKFLHLLKEEEGYRNTVYLDSLGKPTVGVGHLVLPQDNLKVGDVISDERVMELLKHDASEAYQAALKQAQAMGITDSNFVVALGSVNFQLGTGWREKFPNTWATMKAGRLEEAASMLEGTLWSKQTPDRVDYFQGALRTAATRQEMIAENIASVTGAPDSTDPVRTPGPQVSPTTIS